MVQNKLEAAFHAVTAGTFEAPTAAEPFAGGDPFDDGGQDPEAEKKAHEDLMSIKDRLIAEWDPSVLRLGNVSVRHSEES